MGLTNISPVALVAVIAAASSVASAASSTTTNSSSKTQYFITFGDSYSQTGFEINGTLPDAANPLGNPAFPGYTSAGGPNWIGRLISERNLSTLLSYNFADGGATTDGDIVAPYEPTVLSFVDQVTEFTNSIASQPSTTPWTPEDTLFGAWFGVNDVGNTYYQSNVTDILDAIMVSYFAQLQILYDAGARNFVLLSVPPIQESPLMLESTAEARAQEAAIITEYDSRLASNLERFTSANIGVTAKLVNTTIPFQTALDNPTAYGAADATCFDDDGTTCLWFNNYHPALAIHELVAAQVADEWKGKFFS